MKHSIEMVILFCLLLSLQSILSSQYYNAKIISATTPLEKLISEMEKRSLYAGVHVTMDSDTDYAFCIGCDGNTRSAINIKDDQKSVMIYNCIIDMTPKRVWIVPSSFPDNIIIEEITVSELVDIGFKVITEAGKSRQ